MKLIEGQVYDFVAKFPPFRQSSLIITKVTKYSVYCIWSDGSCGEIFFDDFHFKSFCSHLKLKKEYKTWKEAIQEFNNEKIH